MTEQGPRPDALDAHRRAGGLARTAVVLAVVALALSIVGVFWLRLWTLGLVLGAVSLVVGIVAARREGRRPLLAQGVVLLGAAALIVPAVIAAAAFAGWVSRSETVPQREEREIELRAYADGDFTVTHTVPPAAGETTTTIAEIDVTDEFETSLTADLDRVQFFAVISQSNAGPQTIRCEIRIDGDVVLERTGDRRFVDCSADLQDIDGERLGSASPAP